MLEILDQPTENGLYVAYVNPEWSIQFAKRMLLMYMDGQWSYPLSAENYRDVVYGCIGPLPSLRFEE
jgi:hypothetical protein